MRNPIRAVNNFLRIFFRVNADKALDSADPYPHYRRMMQDAIDQFRTRVAALKLPHRRIATAAGCDEKTIRNFIAGKSIMPRTYDVLLAALPELEQLSAESSCFAVKQSAHYGTVRQAGGMNGNDNA